MDSVIAAVSKAEASVKPANAGNMQAAAFPGTHVGAANTDILGQYLSWSGTACTIHTRLLLGSSTHGLGSELC